MAKDYFQDIIPPEESPRRDAPRSIPVVPKATVPEPVAEEADAEEEVPVSPERSIRNINVAPRPVRSSRPSVNDMRDPANFGIQQLPPKPVRGGNSSRKWVWGAAILLLLILGGLALFFFRKTTITVVPRSHTIVFDPTSQFTAYPATASATGTSGVLEYTVATSDLQDSEVVAAQGTQHVEQKAQGTITVYNDYSSSPLKLIANTRFQNPAGLIFRVPDDIVVPGKTGTTPGSVSVTVFADQPGATYNIGPTSRFSVPGLQSDPAMYANVYAQSTASTTGGFVGDQPAADPTAVQNAQADIRSQLEQEARSAAAADNTASTTVLPDLMQITYQDLPQSTEAGGGARINESAHIQIPEFDAESFAQTIGQSVSADTQGAQITLVPGQGFAAQAGDIASSTLGSDPITFSLSGNATLIWQVDANALVQALLGRDQSAFDTIVNGFPSIQEAHARIEPFWKSTFPSNPSDIKVVIEPPQASQ